MKSFRAILGAAVVISLAATAHAQLIDGIRAVVHDSIITHIEVEEATALVAGDLRQRYRTQPEAFQRELLKTLDENLERLLDNELILHEFETAGYNLPESIIDDYIQDRIRDRYGNRVRLMKSLQSEGITYERYRRDLRNQFIITQMRYTHTQGQLIISPHKIEVYYVDHQDQFKVAEQVKLRMIVLDKPPEDAGQTRKLADDILAKIRDNASFAEMASIHSQGAERAQGGDWGWVERSVLRKELAEAAFDLQAGSVSPVIETPEACYLMLVEDKRSEHIRPLSEVREEIEKTLETQEKDRLQRQWLDRLKKKTFVRYF